MEIFISLYIAFKNAHLRVLRSENHHDFNSKKQLTLKTTCGFKVNLIQ